MIETWPQPNARERLQQAADLIEATGWCQRTRAQRTPDGQQTYCAIGAIEHVGLFFAGESPGGATWRESVRDAKRLLATTIAEQYPEYDRHWGRGWHSSPYLSTSSYIACWNDWTGRTQADVVAVLEKASVA